MHPLLKESSVEASKIYDSIPDVSLDWRKLRLGGLPSNMTNVEFLRVLKNCTKTVSASEFKKEFAKCVRELSGYLMDKKWFVLVSETDKSHENYGLYFFLVAINVCPDMCSNLHGILSVGKGFQLPERFKDYVYVYFDDACLSFAKTEVPFEAVKHMPRVLVSPFVGELCLSQFQDRGVHVIYSEVVRAFIKFDPSGWNTVSFKYDCYPLLLSHRGFDEVNGFPEVYDKILSEPIVSPFSGGTFTRYSYLARDIYDRFVTFL